MLEQIFVVLQEYHKNLPFSKEPRDLLTKLLPYQKQGLAWLRKREVFFHFLFFSLLFFFFFSKKKNF